MVFLKASGEIVGRLDADDLYPKDRTRCMVEGLIWGSKKRSKQIGKQQISKQIGKQIIITGLVEYFSSEVSSDLGNGYKRYQTWLNDMKDHKTLKDNLFIECVIPSPGWLMWREGFDEVGYPANTYPEDYAFCFEVFKKGMRVLKLPKLVLKWRDYKDRTSRTSDVYKHQGFWDLKVNELPFFYGECLKQGHTYIWGAGKKGKALAVKCIEANMPIAGIMTNNPRKIGQTFHNTPYLKDQEILKKSNSLILLCLSSPKDVDEAINMLERHEKKVGVDYIRLI